MADPLWRERHVSSWQDLTEVLHSEELVPLVEKAGHHYRSPYVFRGMSDSSWPLKTSLERLGSPPSIVEPALLRSFRKYAPRGVFAIDSDWEVLSIAQHNGLPTRVLDWSVSPLVAAHFATAERQYVGTTGIIWCVNVLVLRDQFMPAQLREELYKAHAAVFDVGLLSRTCNSLSEFDLMKEACMFFEPPSIDARIISQFGILSAMNGPALSHDQYFRHLSSKNPDLVHRIIIQPAAKSQIRDMLDQNNVNERMLFPGMPGLCDWLRRYYGPAYSQL